jgi:hypothetical protein
LTDVLKDFKKITGFLKVSLSVLHAGDSPMELTDDKVASAFDLKDVSKIKD